MLVNDLIQWNRFKFQKLMIQKLYYVNKFNNGTVNAKILII